ncbi:MAG: 6-carboxytetrahydropterin synthase [Phycisphaerales bacterium]
MAVPLRPGERRGNSGKNTFAAWPSPVGFCAWYEVIVTCSGRPADETGYLINIKEIDAATRLAVLPVLERGVGGSASPEALLPEMVRQLIRQLGSIVHFIELCLTPYHAIAMHQADLHHVIVIERFEFAAAHRLHCQHLSDEENRAAFGKCNNPSGHGHNYRCEVRIRKPLDLDLDFVAIEQIVDAEVVQRFDHQHLDRDVPEFSSRTSSVENIAQLCFSLLSQPIASCGAELQQVRIWETEKTSCAYPA